MTEPVACRPRHRAKPPALLRPGAGQSAAWRASSARGLRRAYRTVASNGRSNPICRGRSRAISASNSAARHDGRSGVSKPCCGCAKDSGLRAPGRCANRTSYCRSVSVSRRLVKPETRTSSRPSCGLRQSLRQAPKKPPGPARNDRTVGGLSMIRENREGAHRDGSTVALVLAPDW